MGETRTFKTATGAARWRCCGILDVRRPVSYALEERDPLRVLDVGLATRERLHVRGVQDGLLRPSFVPPPPIRHLRMLTRYRVQLMGDRTPEVVRLEQMLEDASIKLSTVASSLTTVSARAMLEAMVAG